MTAFRYVIRPPTGATKRTIQTGMNAEAADLSWNDSDVTSHHRWLCQEEAPVAAIGTDHIPTTWDNERDTAFFRITASLFPGEFTYGAGVLLASYDDDFFDVATTPVSAVTAAPIVVSSTTTSHATSS